MHEGEIAERYARAFYLFAVENHEEGVCYEECNLLAKLYIQEPRLRGVLHCPITPNKEKEQLLSALLKGGVSRTLQGVIALVLRRGRITSLQRILMDYRRLYQEKKGLHPLSLTTAAPLSDQLLGQICQEVERKLGGEVLMEHQIDSRLIGGFRLQVDDYLYDASISSRLRRLKQALEGPKNRIV
uniref:ATP synthase F1 subunit delta n=1 Tax=Alistipes sp. TaxID=1872444 RepID=UPI004056C0CF